MIGIYLIPVLTVGNARVNKYLYDGRFNPTGLQVGPWSQIDYGFLPTFLTVCPEITPANHATLTGNSDVYSFDADGLGLPVTDPNIDTFFEPLGIPTDWLTPSTDYRELLRRINGMFRFNQRYGRISGGGSILDGRTLDARWNTLSAQEQAWFEQTAAEFGWAGGIPGNPSLRILVKRASDEWGVEPFTLAGVTI